MYRVDGIVHAQLNMIKGGSMPWLTVAYQVCYNKTMNSSNSRCTIASPNHFFVGILPVFLDNDFRARMDPIRSEGGAKVVSIG